MKDPQNRIHTYLIGHWWIFFFISSSVICPLTSDSDLRIVIHEENYKKKNSQTTRTDNIQGQVFSIPIWVNSPLKIQIRYQQQQILKKYVHRTFYIIICMYVDSVIFVTFSNFFLNIFFPVILYFDFRFEISGKILTKVFAIPNH